MDQERQALLTEFARGAELIFENASSCIGKLAFFAGTERSVAPIAFIS